MTPLGFDACFDRLIGNEGGYVNNPSDPGGETKWGISKRSYPHMDIASLTRDDAKAIYLRDFWLRGQMENMPPALAFQAFDAAVNHGIETAIRFLQRAAGVADDGQVGDVTMAAVAAKPVAQMVILFLAERLEFWAKLSTWVSFGRGWANREVTDLRYAAQDIAA